MTIPICSCLCSTTKTKNKALTLNKSSVAQIVPSKWTENYLWTGNLSHGKVSVNLTTTRRFLVGNSIHFRIERKRQLFGGGTLPVHRQPGSAFFNDQQIAAHAIIIMQCSWQKRDKTFSSLQCQTWTLDTERCTLYSWVMVPAFIEYVVCVCVYSNVNDSTKRVGAHNHKYRTKG